MLLRKQRPSGPDGKAFSAARAPLLRQAAHVYDLRSETYLGFTNHIVFTLDPWRPSLFALLGEKIPATKLVDMLAE